MILAWVRDVTCSMRTLYLNAAYILFNSVILIVDELTEYNNRTDCSYFGFIKAAV